MALLHDDDYTPAEMDAFRVAILASIDPSDIERRKMVEQVFADWATRRVDNARPPRSSDENMAGGV